MKSEHRTHHTTSRFQRVSRFGIMLLAAATGLTGCVSSRSAPATSAPNDTGRSVVAGVLGAAMGGGATNNAHAQTLLKDLSAAQRDVHNAEQNHDSDAQMKAGMKMLGIVVRGGGPKVTPIARDALKALLPQTAAGLARETSASSTGSLSGIAASSAHATYGRTGSATIDVTVADLANMGGLAAAANLATTMNIENDEDGGYEKTVDVGGHRIHEKWLNDGKRSDLTEIVDNRYEISIDGVGVSMDSAITVLRSIDMAHLQSLGSAH